MALLHCLEKTVDHCFACLPRRCSKKVDLSAIKIIAHRGAHRTTPLIIENTIAAFDEAEELGCWGIEFDVHFTADGIPVVHHDPDLLRLWGLPDRIDKLTFAKLRLLNPEIPSLAEVVNRYGHRLHLFIELKVKLPAEESFLDCLKMLQPTIDYHLLSLEEPIYSALKHLPREALLLVAGHNNIGKFCQLSLQKNYGGVLGHYLLLTQKKRSALLDAKQKVGVGFVDSKFSLYREINRGHSWIFTNNAKRTMKAFKKLLSKDARN